MLVSLNLPDKWAVINSTSEALQFDLCFTTLAITGYQSSIIPALCLGILASLPERIKQGYFGINPALYDIKNSYTLEFKMSTQTSDIICDVYVNDYKIAYLVIYIR